MKAIPLALLVLLLASGCFSTGKNGPIDLTKAERIQPGTTTISELKTLFGEPWSSKPQTDGTTIHTWQYTKVGMGVGITEQQVVTVTTGADGKVKDYTVKKIP